MLAAIQGTRSAEFEPENCMSPKADVPASKPALPLDKPHVTVDGSPTKAEQNDTVAPLGSKVSSQIQMGLHGVGTSRDSPTFISDDDTSYSTWKPVSIHPSQQKTRLYMYCKIINFDDMNFCLLQSSCILKKRGKLFCCCPSVGQSVCL